MEVNMSSFVLKIIAIISMLFDHTGYIIFHKFSFMNCLGRLAFPIFAFQLTEGYTHTKNLRKYFLRLFLFAIISQLPYMLFLNIFTDSMSLNIFFTLILGLLAITLYEKIKNKYLGIFLVILCAIIAQIGFFDYGWFGIASIFIFHLFKNKKAIMNVSFILLTFINYIYQYIITLHPAYLYIILFCSLALIPINLYNGKKGKDIKYLLYIFYPFHLIVLYIIHFFIL